jgi:hypothetical protein
MMPNIMMVHSLPSPGSFLLSVETSSTGSASTGAKKGIIVGKGYTIAGSSASISPSAGGVGVGSGVGVGVGVGSGVISASGVVT